MLQVFDHRESFFTRLVTHVFLRSLQNGIVVMGFIDAFVYAITSTAKASRILEILVIT